MNFMFVTFFVAHFAFLSIFFVNNFEKIAYAKVDFNWDRPIQGERKSVVRSFNKAKATADKVPVLMYHRILDENQLTKAHYDERGELYGTIVTTKSFEEQMKLLNEEGYTALTMKEFGAFMEGKLEIPKKSVLITFDDGFKDNYVNAYPALKKNGLHATVFLITDRIDREPRDYDPKDAQYLSHADIKAGSDIFEYMSHTDKMHEKNEQGKALLVAKDKKDILKDLEKSMYIVGDNSAFAYPFGEYDKDTLETLEKLDVKMAFTIKDGMAKRESEKLEIPRRGIYPSTTLDIFKNLITYE